MREQKKNIATPSAQSTNPSNQPLASAPTTTVPEKPTESPLETIVPGITGQLSENTQSPSPQGNGTSVSEPSTLASSNQPTPQKVSQSVLNSVVRKHLSSPALQNNSGAIDTFFNDLQKNGYSPEQVHQAKLDNSDLIPAQKSLAGKEATDQMILNDNGVLVSKSPEQTESLIHKIVGAPSKYLEQQTQNVIAGGKQALKGALAVTNELDMTPNVYDDKPLTTKLEDIGTGVLNTVAGTMKSGFGVLGVVNPEIVAFNAATEAVHSLPEKIKATLADYILPPNSDLTDEKSKAEHFDKAINFPFAAISTIASAFFGRNPKEGSAEKAAYEISDVGTAIFGTHALTKAPVKSIEELHAIAQAIADGTATPEQMKAYGETSDMMKNVSPADVKNVLIDNEKTKNYLAVPNQDIVTVANEGETPESLRAKAQQVQDKINEPPPISYTSEPDKAGNNHFWEINGGNKVEITEDEYNKQTALQAEAEKGLNDQKTQLETAADAMEKHQEVASDPQKHIDDINNDNTLSPEEKQAAIAKITESAQIDAAQKKVEDAKIQHIQDINAINNPESPGMYHLVEGSLTDGTVLSRLTSSLEAAVQANEITPDEASAKLKHFRDRMDIQKNLNKALKKDPEIGMKAVAQAEELQRKKDQLSEFNSQIGNHSKTEDAHIANLKNAIEKLSNFDELHKEAKEKLTVIPEASNEGETTSTQENAGKIESAATVGEQPIGQESHGGIGSEGVGSSEQGIETTEQGQKEKVNQSGSMLLTHRAIDAARAALGLNIADKAPSDKVIDFDKAKDRILKNPDEGKGIVSDFLGGIIKALDREGSYVIDIYRMMLRREGELLNDKLSTLKSDKNASQNDIDIAYAEHQVNLSNQDLASLAAKRASSISGQTLQSRQDAIADDMTLDNTLSTARSYSPDGKLTPEQEAHYKDLQTKLDAAEKELADYKEKASKESAQQVFDDEIKGEKPIRKNNILNRTKSERLAKIEDLKKRIAIEGLDIGGNVKQGLSFSNAKLRLIAELGAEHIAMGVTDFAKWTRIMKKDVDGITDNDIDHIWNNENIEGKKIKDFAAEIEKGKGIKLSIDEKTGKVSGMKALLKHLINTGVDNIDDAINAIQERHPELTRREITDAISSYGKTRKLSTDPYELKMQELTAISGMLSQLDDLEKGVLPKTFQEMRPKSEMERELREQINNLKREKQGALQGQVSPEHLRTLRDAWERRVQNSIDKLKKKIEQGDIQKKTKQALQIDAKMLELTREREKLKNTIKNKLEEERLKNRSLPQKVIDTAIKSYRLWLLKNVAGSFVKLVVGATGQALLILKPIDMLFASAFASKLSPLRKVADQAPMFSGDQVTPYAQGIANIFTKQTGSDLLKIGDAMAKTVENAVGSLLPKKLGYEQQEISTKTTNDLLWGKLDDPKPTILDVVNLFHKMLKTPLKNAAFKEAFIKNMNWEAKQVDPNTGEKVDISDPVVQFRVATRALAESDRAIFMNKNIASSAHALALNYLKNSKDPFYKALAASIEFDMPMVRVGTNIALETLQRAAGLGAIVEAPARILSKGFDQTGLTEDQKTGSDFKKYREALKNNLSKLDPDEANAIMRAAVKGSTGLLLFGLGYYFYKHSGGGYVRSESKEKLKQGLKAGDLVVGDINIPHGAIHGVAGNTWELGAQMAWSQDEYEKAGNAFPGTDAFIKMLEVLGLESPPIQAAKSVGESFSNDKGVIQNLITPKKSYLEKVNEQRTNHTELQKLTKIIDDPNTSQEDRDQAVSQKEELQTKNKELKLNNLIFTEKDLLKQSKDEGKPYIPKEGLSEEEKDALTKAGIPGYEE